ncbi:MAG: hypothetical protein ACKOF9_02355 [Burkholderiales bacterium]
MNAEERVQQQSILERTSTSLKHVLEICKSVSILVLGLFVATILVAPSWANKRLEIVGVKVEKINLPFVNLVRTEGNLANQSTAIAAEAVTKALVRISEILPQAQAAEVIKDLAAAQKALDGQSAAVAKLAAGAGLTINPLSSGWLYLGYFNEAGKLGKAASRIDESSIEGQAGKLQNVNIKFDTWVISDGNNCSKPSVEEFVPPAPNGLEISYTIIRATDAPLRILETVNCPAAGNGKYVWAKVEIPRDRARISSISNL